MPNESNDLPPPVNHVFVDYENVHEVDPSIIGSKTVHLTLLLGAQKTKLDATLVGKLLQNASTVEMVRLSSVGKNALDFTLAYYVGRAVLADPCGYFHIVSKDTGFDPLIEHLRSKHIRARRHKDFTELTFSAAAKPLAVASPVATAAAESPAKPLHSTPPVAPAIKPPPKAKAQPPVSDDAVTKLVEYLRKIPAHNRPKLRTAVQSHVITLFRNEITGAKAAHLIELIRKAGHIVINDKDAVTYHLERQ